MLLMDLPSNLEEWDKNTIDMLPIASDVEFKQLEYKSEISQDSLSKAICAFSNTSGGFIVIEMKEPKVKNEGWAYTKMGLNRDHDTLNQDIANVERDIEPPPNINVKCIEYKNKSYVVVQVL